MSLTSTGMIAILAYGFAVSPDGRYVAFDSTAVGVVPFDSDISDVYIRDRQASTTIRISANGAGFSSNGPSYVGTFSLDGRWLSFTSGATNLCLELNVASVFDVFVRDLQHARTLFVSKSSSHVPGNGHAVGGRLAGRLLERGDELGRRPARLEKSVAERPGGRLIARRASAQRWRGLAPAYHVTARVVPRRANDAGSRGLGRSEP